MNHRTGALKMNDLPATLWARSNFSGSPEKALTKRVTRGWAKSLFIHGSPLKEDGKKTLAPDVPEGQSSCLSPIFSSCFFISQQLTPWPLPLCSLGPCEQPGSAWGWEGYLEVNPTLNPLHSHTHTHTRTATRTHTHRTIQMFGITENHIYFQITSNWLFI